MGSFAVMESRGQGKLQDEHATLDKVVKKVSKREKTRKRNCPYWKAGNDNPSIKAYAKTTSTIRKSKEEKKRTHLIGKARIWVARKRRGGRGWLPGSGS